MNRIQPFGNGPRLRVAGLCLVLLSGCAQMNDSQRTRTEAAAVGAVGGAVVGQVVGRSTKSTAVGAGIGGAIGYWVGDQLAGEKAQLASSEDQLRKVAADAKASTEEFKRVNAELTKEIRALALRRSQLQARNVSLQARQVELASQRRDAGILLERTTASLARADKLLAEQRSVVQAKAPKAPPELVTVATLQIDGIERERRALEAAKRQLELMDERRVY